MNNRANSERFAPLSVVERSLPKLDSTATEHGGGMPVLPVPASAPEPPETHPQYGTPTARWAYRDATGAVLFWMIRFDPQGDRKQFFPLSLWREDGELRWRWKGLPDPRPIYNLDKVAADRGAPVIICEGEKSSDAAMLIFPDRVATCSPHGSGAAKRADWSPLRGRQVLIWPDADEPGDRYSDNVARILHEIGCDVSIIDARSLAALCPGGGNRDPEAGWDAANALTEWTNVEALRKEIAAVTKPFDPGPAYVSWEEFTMSAENGLTVETVKGRGDKAIITEVRVAAPFEILGASRDPAGRGWGKWIRWRDGDGHTHGRHVPDAALHGDPSALCGTLADEGLWINRAQQRALMNYLSGVEVDGRVTHVDRTGWHNIGSHQAFVLPDKTIGPLEGDRVVLSASANGPYEFRGTLEEWQTGIGELSRGHVLPVLGLSAAFAGPLLHLTGQEGGGINLVGQSSIGKSTLLQAAASVWGRGASPGYVRAWRATANGLEGVAASARPSCGGSTSNSSRSRPPSRP
jgi:hypothetical protein